MQLESVRLRIRARTVLECLDLAFLVAGRHWMPLLLASVLGAGPVIVFNVLFFGSETVDPVVALLLTAIEAPWATMLITLYLGQITFARQFSWKSAIKAAMGGLFQMILFQGMIRVACLVCFVLAPVIAFGFYYVNEIILLERTRVRKTWGRRVAMNARNMGRIVTFRILDLVVLTAGYWGLVRLLRAISSLWNDRFTWTPDDLAASGFDLLRFQDLEAHIAFWTMICFLAVFRYVTYLDCRIRREGWDVEMLLREQATAYRRQEAA